MAELLNSLKLNTVFDGLLTQVIDHLVAQGQRCVDDGENCLYRGPNGRKCGVGALLPDKLCDRLMESSADRLVHSAIYPDQAPAKYFYGPDKVQAMAKAGQHLLDLCKGAGEGAATAFFCGIQDYHDGVQFYASDLVIYAGDEAGLREAARRSVLGRIESHLRRSLHEAAACRQLTEEPAHD